MKFMEQMQLLDRLDKLIRRKATGNAQQLAERLNVSRRTVYNLLDALRGLGAPIDYCRHRESYYYTCEVKFQFEVCIEGKSSYLIKGGQFFFEEEAFVQKFCTNLM
jgi:biotin operon repressor